jgi:hypothetical protein
MGTRTQPQRRGTDDLPDDDLPTGQQEEEYVINRITIGIIPKAWIDLQRLMTSTRFNRTDVVNRAISIYAVVNDNLQEGYELVFRDPETRKERIVEII